MKHACPKPTENDDTPYKMVVEHTYCHCCGELLAMDVYYEPDTTSSMSGEVEPRDF